MENSTAQKIIIMDLGHLTLYGKSTLQHPMGDGTVFYCDKRFPIEVGPFFSYSEAMEHWKGVIDKSRNFQKSDLDFVGPATPLNSFPDNVIYVDFKMKRRI